MSFQIKNLFSRLYKTAFDIILYTLIFATILALLPNHLFVNFPIEPKSYELVVPEKVDNWNNDLVDKSELLLKGVVIGPESLAIKDNFIYTGLADGRLVEINKKTLKTRDISRFGTKLLCKTEDIADCGRVLGVRFHNDGHLYVIDYVNGLFRVNVTTGVKELIDFKNPEIKGFYDDLEFDPKLNIVYISILTSKWQLNQVMYGLLDYDDTGYVFAYNFDTKTSVKLRTGIRFANGLQLSADKKYLLVAETQNLRISKISLQTIHKAIKANRQLTDTEYEVFATLPGEPDNIRLDPNGDVLVGMFAVRHNGKVGFDYLTSWPLISKGVARTMYVLSLAITAINDNTIGSSGLRAIAIDLYTGQALGKYLPTTGAVIKLDGKTGQIKQILGSNKFNGVTEAVVDNNGDLYFGSFHSPFLGRIKKGNF
ncbi:unnamed protein product, partial [Oppiella nova]